MIEVYKILHGVYDKRVTSELFNIKDQAGTRGHSLSDCHTLPDSTNGGVTDRKILCPFVSVCMRFLSVPHAVNAVSGDIRFARSYPFASFGHVQNFEWRPPDKNERWKNVTHVLACDLSGSRMVCPNLIV